MSIHVLYHLTGKGGEVERRPQQWDDAEFAARLSAKDPTLWDAVVAAVRD